MKIPVKKPLSYGYGGVTPVAVSVLLSLNIEVYISGRRLAEAARVAEDLSVQYKRKVYAWTPQNPISAELFVNATPGTVANNLLR